MSGLGTFFAVALAAVPALGSPAPSGHPKGSEVSLHFEVLENRESSEDRLEVALTLINRGRAALGNEGWELYFNFGRMFLEESVPDFVDLEHVNGDFFKLSPAETFQPVGSGERVRVLFQARSWILKESEAPAGAYFVFAGEPPEQVAEITVAPFLTRRQTNRTGRDRVPVPTPALLFEQNAKLTTLPPEEVPPIVPTPVFLKRGADHVTLDPSWVVRFGAGLGTEADLLADALASLLGRRPRVEEGLTGGPGTVTLRIGSVSVGGLGKKPGDEAYRLVVGEDAVEITGTDGAGVLYAVQSFRALVPTAAYREARESLRIGEVVVEDAPRFPYRGLHLDVARNFQSKETVLKLLDLMAFYKLNRFHFHLSDDEGWRLEIASLPELTEVGARRGHTTDESDRLVPSFGSGPDPERSPGSGYYTRADFVEILRRARDLHVEVVPEIDFPGHARAAIKAMEARRRRRGEPGHLLSEADDRSRYKSVQMWRDNVVNVCQEATYRFLATVVDEFVALYEEAGAPLRVLHTGGDEVPRGVWEGSPACERLIRERADVDSFEDLPAHFLRRLSGILAERGLRTGGWEEIALVEERKGESVVKVPNPAFLDRGFRAWVWNNLWGGGAEDLGYRLANAGYEVVLANVTNLYFDLAYDKHPEEPGYYWAGFVDTRKAYELVPLDIYKSAWKNSWGYDVDPATLQDRVRLTDKGRANVLGIQGQIWGENAKSRTLMEYLAFPKALALAERAWAARPAWSEVEDRRRRARELDAAWNVFANSLGQRELPRLDFLFGGVAYRLPPPGARIEKGRLEANVAFPGLAIRYTTDGSEPTPSSLLYTKPVPVEGNSKTGIRLKTFDRRGRSSRTSELL